jgi:hypothetical protein
MRRFHAALSNGFHEEFIKLLEIEMKESALEIFEEFRKGLSNYRARK